MAAAAPPARKSCHSRPSLLALYFAFMTSLLTWLRQWIGHMRNDVQAEEPAYVGPSPTSLLELQSRVDNVQACLETLLNGMLGATESRIFSHDHV